MPNHERKIPGTEDLIAQYEITTIPQNILICEYLSGICIQTVLDGHAFVAQLGRVWVQ